MHLLVKIQFTLVIAVTAALATPRPNNATQIPLSADARGEIEEGRNWTTDDSVAIRTFGFPGDWVRIGGSIPPPIVASPDGRYFFILSNRGDLANKTTVETLEIYDSGKVLTWLDGKAEGALPEPISRIERGTHRLSFPDAITSPRWDEDSNGVAFTGRDLNEVPQAYRLDVKASELRPLSSEPISSTEVTHLNIHNGGAIYRRRIPKAPDKTEASKRPLFMAAPRNSAGKIKFPRLEYPYSYEWIASYEGKSWALPIGYLGVPQVSFSPNGRMAVMILNFQGDNPKKRSLFEKFILIDLASQTVSPLGEVAQNGQTEFQNRTLRPTRAQAFWTNDGSEVILVNTLLPTDHGLPGMPEGTGYIAAYEIASGRSKALEALAPAAADGQVVSGIGWLELGKSLLVTRQSGGRPSDGTVYSRSMSQWEKHLVNPSVSFPESRVLAGGAGAMLVGGLKVFVRQSANDAPVLIASNGTIERVLSQPDPALQGVWRAHVVPFSFQTTDGQTVTAGLSLPRGFKTGMPVPLVVQLSYKEGLDRFLPDGDVPSGFARQALIAQGFAVLAMPGMDFETTAKRINDIGWTSQEGARFVECLDSAVEELARQGLVDPKRVGLIGQSRTGYQTLYAVTHPRRIILAAAEAWDNSTAGVTEYLWNEIIEGGYDREQFERVNGGPLWQNKTSWMEHDVTMNADRVETPSLFVVSVGGAPFSIDRPTADQLETGTFSTIGAFQLNDRPIDYMFAVDGGHTLQAAVYRKAAMDLTVDWMNFWLQGKVDGTQEKIAQYQRWQIIRQQNVSRKAREHSETKDAEAKNKVVAEMKMAGVQDPAGNGQVLNAAGYHALYEEHDISKALTYLRWNLILFRNTKIEWQLEDGLAEGCILAGLIDEAVAHYRRSMELNPAAKERAGGFINQLQRSNAGIEAVKMVLAKEHQDYLEREADRARK